MELIPAVSEDEVDDELEDEGEEDVDMDEPGEATIIWLEPLFKLVK